MRGEFIFQRLALIVVVTLGGLLPSALFLVKQVRGPVPGIACFYYVKIKACTAVLNGNGIAFFRLGIITIAYYYIGKLQPPNPQRGNK